MPSKALRLAAVLILAASQTAIAERTFARGGSSGVSHGHVVGGSHFPHGHFGHRLRRNPVFIAGGVRPGSWTVSCGGFDSLPGVVILELCWA